MERKELRDRLHLSGIDGQAAALAGKWRLGFEIAEFCWAPRLEQPDAMELVRQQIAGVERLWLHAPFAELAPCAIDPLVREAALRRFRQTIRTARMLGVKRIVVHGGYIPLVYFPEWYVEQSAVFWKELLADVPPAGVLDRKVRRGTGDIAREDAMTRQQVLDAMAAGMEQAARARADGVTALGIGEMGIGNTTTSAAVLAALTGADIEAVTGRGGGLTDEGFLRKKEVLRQALALHRPDGSDVIGVLAGVGGLDLAAMTGAFLGCAHERVPAAVDGFISIAAALCAVRLCPAVRDVLFLSHDSYEVGYRIAAETLGLQPCLRLGMRLGEGSGCPLLFRVLEGACGVMRGMATFGEASIEDSYLDEIRAVDAFTVEAT